MDKLSCPKVVATKITKVDRAAFTLFCSAERPKVLATYINQSYQGRRDVTRELKRRWTGLGKNEKDAYTIDFSHVKVREFETEETLKIQKGKKLKKHDTKEDHDGKVEGVNKTFVNSSNSTKDYFQYVADNWQTMAKNRPEMSGLMIQTILWDRWDKKNLIKVIRKDTEYKVDPEKEVHKLTKVDKQRRKDTEYDVDEGKEAHKLEKIDKQIRKDTEFKVVSAKAGNNLTKIEPNNSSSEIGKDVRPTSEGSFSVFVSSMLSLLEKEMPGLNHEEVTEALKQKWSRMSVIEKARFNV